MFGQATLNLTDALRVTLGARYGKETVDAQTKRGLPPLALAPFAPGVPISASVTDNYFSYRVGAQYDVSRDVMVYGTYTHGYKGPSINDQTGGGKIPLIVRPEIPKAFEVGLKSTLFDGRLAANVALFHTKITDFQAQFYDAGLASFVFGNAPSMTTKGVSVSLFGRPLPGLSLNVGGIYNDATYGKGYLVTCAQGQTLAQGCEPVLNGAGVQIGTADDVDGNRLAGAPKWKVTASAEYVADLMDDLQGFIQTDVVYTSRVNYNAAFDPINSSNAAATVGGRLGVRTGDERFGVSVFVRNLFDKYREVYRFATPTAAQQRDVQSYSQISGPDSRRTIGVSFDARF